MLKSTYRKCEGNELEMSCVLAQEMCLKFDPIATVPGNVNSGNVPEIRPYTVPGNVKEMSKFPGVENVHTMNNNRYDITYPYINLEVQITISLKPAHPIIICSMQTSWSLGYSQNT